MATKADLNAALTALDTKLDSIKTDMSSIKNDMSSIKTDMSSIKNDHTAFQNNLWVSLGIFVVVTLFGLVGLFLEALVLIDKLRS